MVASNDTVISGGQTLFLVTTSSPLAPITPKPNPNANNILVILGVTKFISLTMLRVASKSLISFVGIVLNMILVCVTVRTRSLHGTCNIFIALNALFTAFFELSYIIEFTIALLKWNPIALSLCFWLQLLPLFGTNCTTMFILFIGVDRFISIGFPAWQKRLKRAYYVFSITAICWSYSLFVVYMSFLTGFSRYPNRGVGCQVADLYYDELADIILLNNIFLNLSTISCYIGVWILIRRLKREVSAKFFKSLTAIMMSVFLGWFLFSISSIIIESFKLSSTNQWYLLVTIGILMSAADASHMPILFVFSLQYRRAFMDHFAQVGRNFCQKRNATSVKTIPHNNIGHSAKSLSLELMPRTHNH